MALIFLNFWLIRLTKTKDNAMHNLRNKFDSILSIVKHSLTNFLDNNGNLPRPGPKPRFSDAEVIALDLLAESLMITSENYLFKFLHNNLKDQFPYLIERSRYNRRKRELFSLIEQVRIELVKHLIGQEDTFLIDSMPLPIVKLSRAPRARICKEESSRAPDHGYCASQNQKYYGYKFHATSTIDGVITHFTITKAHVHDIEYLQEIRDFYPGCTILGDRAYLSDPLQLELFENDRLMLITPMRRNQRNYRKQPSLFRRLRKRIETVFSQFCDQFQIQKNYAKTFLGLATRILSKITAFTLLQYLNKYKFKNKLNHVKHVLV